ncbi:hypothetical protein J2793_007564 [Paraburkholderia caledonica]|uniref:Uncharacterized protein n=1 Tax=Paraburkholderia caledonica TaxID=134536 RepID=A0AB73IPX1_9BURK|nr:hypothetical protein [Paraburkholderia caledonica]
MLMRGSATRCIPRYRPLLHDLIDLKFTYCSTR